VNTDHDERTGRDARTGFGRVAAFPGGRFQSRDAVGVTLLYIGLTVAFTWPIGRGLTRDIPADFGDSLFIVWAMTWDLTHAGRGLWNANIFYPHPLALAYSEHMFGLALQALPVFVVTRNPILCYNVVFLSTFVLSGLGMFLLMRELTGSRGAALVAGVAFAFAPYRIASLPHLQVLASAWMPLTIFGFRRYFASGRRWPLAGAGAAWIMQNLSCGYYLVYFSIVVFLYLLWEITTRSRWTDRRTLVELSAACMMVGAATLPFLMPYLALRREGVRVRDTGEIRRFAADVYGYATADPKLWLWGGVLRAWPKPEGALFPGFTVVVLAGVGVLSAWRAARQGREEKRLATVLALLLVAASAIALMLLVGWRLRAPGLSVTRFGRAMLNVGGLSAALLMVSRRARSTTRRFLTSPAGIWVLIAVFAVLMSFGIDIEARGRVVATTSIYAWFYRFVPGFDGLRVPARFAMIVACALAALAAFGVKGLASVRSGRRVAAAAAVACAILLESLALPLPVNVNDVDYKTAGLAPLPGSLFPEPPVYRFVAALPPSTAIVELPLGETAFDVRYMFYSTRHWKPLVNGYSGSVPQDYAFLSVALEDALQAPDRAWRLLLDSRATHGIVHEAYYAGDRGARMSALLRARGAHEVAAFGADHVFELPIPTGGR
jgi:hypothetical protein